MIPTIYFNLDENDDCFRITLAGQLDEQSFYTLSEALTDRKLDRPIRLDLRGIEYADSTGLRALVLLQRRAKEAGAEFILANPSPSVDRLFRVTGLWKVFHIENDPPAPSPKSNGHTGETAIRPHPAEYPSYDGRRERA
jgi:anti-sigma B factor antagonist